MYRKILLFVILLTLLFSLAFSVQAKTIFERLQEGLGRRGEEAFVQVPAEQVVVNVIMWMMSILGIIAVGFIIWGGIMYATSGGNEEQITRAKKILLWAIVGLVIAILALVIARLVTVAVTGGNACEIYYQDKLYACQPTPCRDLTWCTQPQFYPGYSCTPASSSCPAGQSWGPIDNMCGCKQLK